MLRFLLLLVFMSFSVSAFACWKVVGSLSVDGETYKINNRFDHNKEYLFPMGNFIVKLLLKPQDKKRNTLVYVIHEKKGTKLTLISKGEEEDLIEGAERDIFAKGEEGQPNSIITVKLIHI
ncbi:MAG: hypothetical protein ACLGHN_11770 [Bacteriovoracia bacterium]